MTHVVKQGEVRFAFTSSLNPNSVDIATHHARHGDGVRDVAIRVKDCRALYDELISSGATSVEPPHEISDAHGSAVVASIQTYGDTVPRSPCALLVTRCHTRTFPSRALSVAGALLHSDPRLHWSFPPWICGRRRCRPIGEGDGVSQARLCRSCGGQPA